MSAWLFNPCQRVAIGAGKADLQDRNPQNRKRGALLGCKVPLFHFEPLGTGDGLGPTRQVFEPTG